MMKKIYIHKRPAFSMITAIFVILLMASVAAFIMNLSGKTIQETTTQYRKEQAILLAKSYTEFAIMAATARDCARPTITANVNGSNKKVKQGEGYKIIINTRYIGKNSGCTNRIGGDINTPVSQGGTVRIDTYVRYRDPESPNALANRAWSNNEPGITYHRRTLQRL